MNRIGDNRKRVTANDVARRAGVSKSAVSRAFTPGAYISEEMRAKVISASGELGYVPNAIARSLTTSRSNIIAIVMSNLSSAVYQRMLEIFNEKLFATGRNVFLLTATEKHGDQDYLKQILQYQVDGVVVTAAGSLSFSESICRQCVELGIPTVTLNRTLAQLPISSINCDHRGGGQMAADSLIDAGHTRLGIIAGDEDTTVSIERAGGFANRLAERGASPPMIERCRLTVEDGYQAATRLLRAHANIDGVFCINDVLAIGTIEAARREFRREIPNDLSVVGFDDIPAASWPSYNLTTIRQRLNAIVNETINVLVDHMEDDSRPRIDRIVPVELVVRGSARVPQASTGNVTQTPIFS